jgi:hypothetical protein
MLIILGFKSLRDFSDFGIFREDCLEESISYFILDAGNVFNFYVKRCELYSLVSVDAVIEVSYKKEGKRFIICVKYVRSIRVLKQIVVF